MDDVKEISSATEKELVETDFLEKINYLKLKNNLPYYQKDNYFVTLHSIGQHFDSVLNKTQSIPLFSKGKSSLLKICIKNNVIDIFCVTLSRLFNNDVEKDLENEMNDKVFKSIEIVFKILIKCSAVSVEFGNEICKRESLLNFFFQILEAYKIKFLSGHLSEYQSKILEYCISTLYNTVMHDTEFNIQKLQQLKIMDHIKVYLRSDNKHINLLLLAAFTSEGNDKEQILLNIIDLLSKLIHSQHDSPQGMIMTQLIKGLKKLSRKDENKRRLVELKILPILQNLIEKKCFQLKKNSLSILWNLAMDDKNKKQIKEMFQKEILELKHKEKEDECTLHSETNKSQLKKLLDTDDCNKKTKKESKSNFSGEEKEWNLSKNMSKISEDEICKDADIYPEKYFQSTFNLDGILWSLQDNQKSNSEDVKMNSNEEQPKDHFMISYCHKDEIIAFKIYNDLKKKNFKLWIDKHDIGSSQNLMESMAQAVEQSQAVIMCISQNYKNSESCRAEAQYAKSTKKLLIPIIVQEKYRPDGWLGLCIAGIQYHNLVGKCSFDEFMATFMETLVKLLKQNESQTNKNPGTVAGQEKKDDNVKLHPIVTNKNQVSDWTNKEVSAWLKKIGIIRYKWKSHYTGSELQFLKTLTGETFVEFCQEDLEISDLKDIRVLSEELKKL